uniref:Uncharacterized protein n=1 Tax=Panagrolaimus davidi TaxID=227884 RepID=A0A914PIU7_9BILA
MSALQKIQSDGVNHSILYISAIVLLSLTVLSVIGLACYGKIKKEIENENENNSVPDEAPSPPPEIYVSLNSSALEFDQSIFYLIEKLENIKENNSGNLPSYNSAILNCAPIKIIEEEDIEGHLPPPYYYMPKDDAPPGYHGNIANNVI